MLRWGRLHCTACTQSSPLARTARFLKKRSPPCYYVRGVFALRSLPMRPPRLSSAPAVFLCPSLWCSGRSVCGRGLRWVADAPIKAPPLAPPSGGGLRGLPEEAKAESTRGTPPRIPLPHHTGKKEKNEHTYTIYRGFPPLHAEYSTKKA